jgi:AmmeMemoRadiSam system protein B
MRDEVREPAVSGAFYPSSASELERHLAALVDVRDDRHELLACIAPHAGYMYSGWVAGQLYGHLDLPKTVIILGPNHSGYGDPVAVAPQRSWRTPLGEIPADPEVITLLSAEYPALSLDEQAHWREHSIEVQLPFLLRRQPQLRIVPVCLQHLGLEACIDLGHAIARAIVASQEAVGIVASSDMTHYQPDETVRRLDRQALDAIEALDLSRLYETAYRGRSMCGAIPSTVALAAAIELGATAAHVVAYATSGDTSGDRSSVVGYAGVCIHR